MRKHPCNVCGDIWHSSLHKRLDIGDYELLSVECPKRGFVSTEVVRKLRRRYTRAVQHKRAGT